MLTIRLPILTQKRHNYTRQGVATSHFCNKSSYGFDRSAPRPNTDDRKPTKCNFTAVFSFIIITFPVRHFMTTNVSGESGARNCK